MSAKRRRAERDNLPNSGNTPAQFATLPLGTQVVATQSFGLVKDGTAGIIVGLVDTAVLQSWSRPRYLCMFAGNLEAVARAEDIAATNHGYRLETLKKPAGISEADALVAMMARHRFE